MNRSGIAGLAYVWIEAKDLGSWNKYATDVLGMEIGPPDKDGSLVLRMDERLMRFKVSPGGDERVRALAWEVHGREDWTSVLERLGRFGAQPEILSEDEASLRSVSAVARCTDPSGHPVEIVASPLVEPVQQCVSPTGVTFVTADQGMGHVTLVVTDYERTVRFYSEALGFQVRDHIDTQLRATFLSCNPRHHTVALIDGGARSFLDHVMVEVESIDMVGRALDKVLAGGAGLTQHLGRHWNDRMLSFYMRSPSGFQIEYGCEGRRVETSSWVEVRQGGIGGASIWGHRPTEIGPDYGAIGG